MGWERGLFVLQCSSDGPGQCLNSPPLGYAMPSLKDTFKM